MYRFPYVLNDCVVEYQLDKPWIEGGIVKLPDGRYLKQEPTTPGFTAHIYQVRLSAEPSQCQEAYLVVK